MLRKEWEGNPREEKFWNGKEKYGELDEAYENAKEVLHAQNILSTQDEIFRKLKNRGSDRGSAFGGIQDVKALDKVSDYDHYNEMLGEE